MKSFIIVDARWAESQEPVCVQVEDGKIVGLASSLAELNHQGQPVYQAEGALLLPGLYDMHVHIGEPGMGKRETMAQATEAAINGGVTGFVAIPDKQSPLDKVAVLSALQAKSSSLRLPIQFAANITESGDGLQQSSYGNLANQGIKLLSDGNVMVQNPLLLRRAMQYAGDMGLVFAMRGDTAALTSNALADESNTAYSLGLGTSPACAEQMGVFTALSLGMDTQAAVHIQTLSCAEALEVFKAYKSSGNFTAEVALHHLLFTHEDIGDFNTTMKTIPPLRGAEDVAVLLDALNEGVIDCIVSDHTACTPFEKMQDFCSAPEGMTELDTFLPVVYTRLIATGKLTWATALATLCHNPRRIMGVEPVCLAVGASANFVLLNTQKVTVVKDDFLESKGRNTPWLHEELPARVTFVVRDAVLKNELI